MKDFQWIFGIRLNIRGISDKSSAPEVIEDNIHKYVDDKSFWSRPYDIILDAGKV